MKLADYARIGVLSGALALSVLMRGGMWQETAQAGQPAAGHGSAAQSAPDSAVFPEQGFAAPEQPRDRSA